MFSYCNNNAINHADNKGHYPGDGSDPLEQLIPAFIEWFLESDENEKDSEGKSTFNAKLKKTAQSILDNFVFSIGVGLGYYGDFEVSDIGVSAGMYGNLASLNYSDGEWYTGQELYTGVTTSLFNIQDIGFADSKYIHSDGSSDNSSWFLVNSEQREVTLFSAGLYIYGGGSIYIGYDFVTLYEDLAEIYND